MKKKIYRLVVFLTAISLILGSCGQATSEASDAGKTGTTNTPTPVPTTYKVTIDKGNGVSDTDYEIYKSDKTTKITTLEKVEAGNIYVKALVDNIKVNGKAVAKAAFSEAIKINDDTTIKIEKGTGSIPTPVTYKVTIDKGNGVSNSDYAVYKSDQETKITELEKVEAGDIYVKALVDNIKVNGNAVAKATFSEAIKIDDDTTITITYESNATTETEKLKSDKELVESGCYTVSYSATPKERLSTLNKAVAQRIKYGSSVSVELDSNIGIYVAKLQNGSEKETVNLVVAEENNFCRMILIPASGNITLGGGECEGENPEHQANVKTFKMCETLVTQKLFKEIMGFNPSYAQGNFGNDEDENLRPVDTVSWFNAVEFCNKLTDKVMGSEHRVYELFVYERLTASQVAERNASPSSSEFKFTEGIYKADVIIKLDKKGFRLPSNDEWEWAAGCGDIYRYAGSDILDEVGWNLKNSGKITREVKKLKPNKFGLYDMTGNLWEIIGELMEPDPDEMLIPYKGTKVDNNKVFIQRGGCAYCPFVSGSDFYYIKFLRTDWREENGNVHLSDYKTGFRIVCNAE